MWCFITNVHYLKQTPLLIIKRHYYFRPKQMKFESWCITIKPLLLCNSNTPNLNIGFLHQKENPTLNVKSPLHKRKAPLLTTFWRRFCVKPSVPWKWRCGCKCDLTEQESICYTNQGCSANKQIMGCWGRSHKSSHFKTALNHFKTKHEKGVGRPLPIEATATQSGNCSWFAAKSSRIFPLLAV